MQPTYFASFLLGEPSQAAPTIAAALEVVGDWIFDNPYRSISRPRDWPNVSGTVEFLSGEKISLLRIEDEAVKALKACALRYEHPDQKGRLWRTDCVLSQSDPDPQNVRFSLTVSAGGAFESEFAIRPPSTRPRVVRQIVDKFRAREHYAITPQHLTIRDDEAPTFAKFLLDPQRKLPLIFVSRRNQNEECLCNVSELAGKLVGIAYVCVAQSSKLSWALAEHIDNQLNAYDGTIRLYWPRMTLNDSPHRHRWWNRWQLADANRRISDDLLTAVATASVTRHVPGLVRWEDVERESTLLLIQDLKKNGDLAYAASEEWLKQYEVDLTALEAAKKEIDSLSGKVLQHEEEVRRWKQTYLQVLRSQSSSATEESIQEVILEDASTAIAIARSDFSASLEIIEARVSKEARLFEEPELLYAALKWLATTYFESKTGARSCSDLNKSCREASRFKYAAHQSDITMSMFAADYEVTFGGKKVRLPEHIGYGSSTEPRHTIRIAFFFSPEINKVVVGFVGQHQATRSSN
ncbi:MAG: hypothetical protein KF807_00200 [Xanthobacteraceae bacterium]|nr:hypothetical protein [Xanthobacteraceae bacterium]